MKTLRKIIIAIQGIVIILCTQSCIHNSLSQSKKKMHYQKIFYTQEGTPYIVKTANKYLTQEVIAVQTNILPAIYVNWNTGATIYFASTQITSNKKIIPISFSLSAIESNTENIAVDITTSYFFTSQGITGTLSYATQYRSALAKIHPYIQRIFYTSSNYYNYQLQYNDLVFSDQDFVEVNNRLQLNPVSNIPEAFTFVTLSNVGVINPGTYDTNLSFTYFEML